VLTENLHCRLLSLTNGDFNAIANATKKFARPIDDKFQSSPNILAWNEMISFQDAAWSWASGVPVSQIRLRIAVFHMGTLHATALPPVGVGSTTYLNLNRIIGVFGIISGFSSLSNTLREFISRSFIADRVSPNINLRDILNDSGAHSSITGYTYYADGVFHTMSTMTPRQLPLKFQGSMRSIQFRTPNGKATIEVDQNADLSVSAEDGDPAYAIEDSQLIFTNFLQMHFDPITVT